MYRVLIAEDEMLVRLGLKNLINWENYNMKIIADVSNGLEAWEVFEREKPELVITDIKMPVMDGIELIKKIRQIEAHTKIIILSCVEDFDIAVKAITLGVSEYISKLTMNRSYIESIMSKVENELNLLNITKADEGKLENSQEERKLEVLRELVFKSSSSMEISQNQANSVRMRLEQKNLVLYLFEIDGYNNISDSRMNTIAIDTIRDIFQSQPFGEVLVDNNNNRFIAIMSFPEIKTEADVINNIEGFLDNARKLLKNYVGITVTIGISSIRNGYGCLSEQYKEAYEALRSKFCFGISKSYYWNSNRAIQNKSEALRRLTIIFNSLIKRDLINTAKAAGFGEKLSEFLKSGFESDTEIRKMFFQLMYWHSIELSNYGLDIFNELFEYQHKMNECVTLDELLVVYEKYIELLREISSKKRFISKDVANAINYMESNCHRDMTLQQVADYVGLSPNYLSSLIKKELEQSFVEYLTNVRIQRAKKLLLETNQKLYEIAENAGFSDEAYFSRTFKKYTGNSPMSFRQKYLVNLSGGAAKDENL